MFDKRVQEWYETHGGSEISAFMTETDPFGIADLLAAERLKTVKLLEELAYHLPHEQSEDPAEGMIPTQSCAHCQILLTVIPAVRSGSYDADKGPEK